MDDHEPTPTPPIKPKPLIAKKPSVEAYNAARSMKSKKRSSGSPLPVFVPTGLSGENSPSTPPRRPPPQIPVAPSNGTRGDAQASKPESSILECRSTEASVAAADQATSGRDDAAATSGQDGAADCCKSQSVHSSASCTALPPDTTSEDPAGVERVTSVMSDISAVSQTTASSSSTGMFSSGSEVDSENEEEGGSMASGETSPPEEVFYAIVRLDAVTKPKDEPPKEEDETLTKSMSKEEKAVFKMKKTAEELMTTEQTYVAGLELLAKDLKEVLQQAQADGTCKGIDGEKIKAIFGVLPEIYGIHVRMLDELTQRIANWELSPKIGDIMCEFAPFLRVYGNYTMNFEQSVKTVSDMAKADKKFKAVIMNFERQPKCKLLGISHYMLTPVQRIPRYNLLLREYLKWAPADYPDRPAAERSLEEISVAADKADHQIMELENFNKVMMVQLSVVDKTDLVQPGAILVRHGPLMKQSRKSFQQRYFFLFNNLLVHANPVTNQPFGEGGQYRTRDRLPIAELWITETLVAPLPHAFTINSRSRSVCVAASSAEEKAGWIQDVRSCAEKWKQTQSTRIKGDGSDTADGRLGTAAPVWLHDSSASMCMICAQAFSTFRRRHHCRCCGKVCCSNCSSREAFLDYSGKKDRVCDKCFYHLSGKDDSEVDKRKGKSVPGVREVKGYDADSVATGYLHLKTGPLRWKRYWFQVRDLALFWYRAPEDVVALGNKPLPGHSVERIKKGSHGTDKENSFRIFHKNIGTILLSADNEEERDRWVSVLTSAIMGD